MDVRVYKLAETLVEHVDEALSRLDGLTVEQANWRPVPGGTNSCWVIAVHVVGASEELILKRVAGGEVDRDRDAEFSATATGIADFGRLASRWQALRPRLLETVENLRPERLDVIVEHPRQGRMTAYSMLVLALAHAVSHASEASLTRMAVTNRAPGSPHTGAALPNS